MSEEFKVVALPAGVQLLPCPFCGSPGELNEYNSDGAITKVVSCTNGGDDWSDGECVMYMPSNVAYKATKREAIEVWNSRLVAPRSQSAANERAAKDYAIEHAEYMAVNAEQLIEHLNEISNVDDCTLEPDDRFGDYVGGLRLGIYEFRKRRDRCLKNQVAQGDTH